MSFTNIETDQFFGDYKNALKNKLKKNKQEFAMMIDTQHKVSSHFRFVEQLICPDLISQTHCLLLVRSQPS